MRHIAQQYNPSRHSDTVKLQNEPKEKEEEKDEEEELRALHPILHPPAEDTSCATAAEDRLAFQLCSAAAESRSGNTSTHSTLKQKDLQTFNQNRSIVERQRSCQARSFPRKSRITFRRVKYPVKVRKTMILMSEVGPVRAK